MGFSTVGVCGVTYEPQTGILREVRIGAGSAAIHQPCMLATLDEPRQQQHPIIKTPVCLPTTNAEVQGVVELSEL
jgi:hypothetical protein